MANDINETTRDQAPSPEPGDAEFQHWLNGAYDAPPVPRSLLKRIDKGIEAEWGQSPKLAESRTDRLYRSFLHNARWAKAVPVGASLVLFVVLVVIFSDDSRAFGWASMIEALEKQGVVRMEGPNGSRWLSLKEGIVSERTADSSRMLDMRKRTVLERNHGAEEIRRRKLPSSLSLPDRNSLVLGFLLGDALSEDEWLHFSGVQVIDESWESVTKDDREEIVLHVQFETATNKRFQLDIILSPESQLPLACEVTDSEGPAVSQPLSYPSVEVTELRQRNFPLELPVINVDENSEKFGEVASIDRSSTEKVVESVSKSQTELKVKSTDSSNAVVNGEEKKPDEEREDRPPMSGEPSEWKPVKIVNRSDDEVRQQVDSSLVKLWKENGVEPAPPADDAELLRRVYLDLAGRTPTVHEVRAYLNNDSENRYESLVDRLLKSPDHASHLATVWRRFLIPEGVDLTDFGGVEAFDQWLAKRFSSNDSYDEVVRSLLLAEGRLSRSGPLLFYSSAKLDADQLASRTARVFLGMRLECAQCHDHPFEFWTQDDFWGFAAFFARISRPQAELEAVSSVMQVRDVNRGEVMLPETEQVVAPKFLDNAEIVEDKETLARRERLARWMTSAENPYFARATANRVWGHMFGKGIVDPVDAFGIQNSPKSPELLDLLAGHFINTNFNLRELFRTVALSRAYRLSSGAATVDKKRLEWFAQMNVKTLTAEQLYDCITVATMLDSQPTNDPYDFNVTRFGNTERERFIQKFRTPSGQSTDYQGGIPQALTLMNGSLIENATGLSSSGLLKSLEAPFFTNKQRIEVLYMATLSRRPRPSEWQFLNSYIPEDASGTELREYLADVLWALLNSAEFTMNH